MEDGSSSTSILHSPSSILVRATSPLARVVEDSLTARGRLTTPVRVTGILNLNLLLTLALRLRGAAVRV